MKEKMRKMMAVALALCLCVAGLAACGKSTAGGEADITSDPEQKVFRLGVLLPGLDSEYWSKTVGCAVGNAEADLIKEYPDWDIEVTLEGPGSEDQTDTFVNILEQMIASGKYNSILIASLVEDPVAAPIADAVSKGILVNLYGFDVAGDENNWGFNTVNDFQDMGAMAATEMYDLLVAEGKSMSGTIAVFNSVTLDSTDGMIERFKTDLLKLAPDLNILDTKYNENDAVTGMNQVEQVIETYGDDLVGMYCANNTCGAVAGKALEQKGLDLSVVASFSDEEVMAGVESGYIDVLLVGNDYQLSYQGVRCAFEQYALGKEFDKEMLFGNIAITAEDLETLSAETNFDLYANLYPTKAAYGKIK